MSCCFETDTFIPHPLLKNAHLQTMVTSRIKRPLPDDWDQVKTKKITLFDNSEILCRYLIRDPGAPTLFILHGMAGSHRSRYVLGLTEKSRILGWNAVFPDMYDVSTFGKPPTVFHSGCSRLLDDLLRQVAAELSLTRVFISGVSIGGNILLKMIGEWGSSYPEWVTAAAVISPLTDLPGSTLLLELPSTVVYRRRFLKKLRNSMLQKAVRYQKYLDAGEVLKARTIRQFDEAFTVPLSGFGSADEYYETQSSQHVLSSIQVPTYIVHSKDDPLLTCTALESDSVQKNPFITLCFTEKGGHVGFLASRPDGDRGRHWAENRILDYLENKIR